nr:GFA family protein [Desulfosarcinaceae bacterium]
MEREFGPEYASIADANFTVKYRARCHCTAVQYEVCADPVDAKICHCRTCQKLHGAPMQWAAIFNKHDVRMTKGVDCLKFYNSERHLQERVLPCKVSCAVCGTPIADEGRRMWLAFPSLFDFGQLAAIPEKFK